jgi:chloride channel 7
MLIEILVGTFTTYKWNKTQGIIDSGTMFAAFTTYTAISALLGGLAGLMTNYVGPASAGSGTAELIAYLNGIHYPGFIQLRTLITKIFAMCGAVSSGLMIGKEGPLAHIGAVVAHATLYLPYQPFVMFRNEAAKREIACAGAAAGVAAAFGSPIGGSLFIFEVAKGSTFWHFDLMWKIFYTSCVSTFTLNMLSSVYQGKELDIANAGLIKFGSFDSQPYELKDFPYFILLGVMGGLLGAFFNYF